MTENSDNAASEVIDTKRRNRNRAFLVALVILGMMPLFAAIVMYYGAGDRISGAQTNSGALLSPPGDFKDLSLTDGGVPASVEGPRLWRLVLVMDSDCDDACLEQVTLLRQLHLLLGRDNDRIARVAALPPGFNRATRAALSEAFPRMELLDAPAELLSLAVTGRRLAGGNDPSFETGLPEHGLLVIDPLGNVVMLHSWDQIGPPLLGDLRRLLRLSNIG